MERTNLTDDDEGKTVVDHEGNKVGMITGFRGGTAYVEPDPGLTDQVKGKLGWTDVDTDDYPLDESKVDRITDDEVRLRRDFESR